MKSLLLAVICLTASLTPCLSSTTLAKEPIVGMYVHTHWPYNHPYAARTWTFEDWRGYLTGLKAIGYNTVLFWPLIETMPRELTESDQAHLDKVSRVIDMAQNELGMRFYLVLCPNIIADDAVAGQAEFERRHFFHSDLRVNPRNAEAVSEMIERRKAVLRPLANANGIVIIDSDPGGYPGSTNTEFVDLLMTHRQMFDQLRPGIELVYWMHAGWPAYSRFYESGNFKRGTPAEFEEVLGLLKARNPEPWFVANNPEAAEKMGVADRVVNFRYGQIEQEPQFPLTNFWEEKAYAAGADSAPRGIVGNAQTHILQLPNTLAFARGTKAEAIGPADFQNFADKLITGQGSVIAQAWRAMASKDSDIMGAAAADLQKIDVALLKGGALQGLLFNDPARYVTDLIMQLKVAAAYNDLMNADKAKSDLLEPLARFHEVVRPWQERTGYQNQWKWPDLRRILATLNSPEIDAVLSPVRLTNTPFGKVKEGYYGKEKETTRLLDAIQATLERRPQARP
jgi:hypothetical protein